MSGKTYIDFLNEHFELDSKNKPHPKPTCPEKIHMDSILGGFTRVLIENQDQYLPVEGMTSVKMFKTWLKQIQTKN